MKIGSSGVSVRKNRGSKSEPEAMLQMQHMTSGAEGAPIVSLAPMRICLKGVAVVSLWKRGLGDFLPLLFLHRLPITDYRLLITDY